MNIKLFVFGSILIAVGFVFGFLELVVIFFLFLYALELEKRIGVLERKKKGKKK